MTSSREMVKLVESHGWVYFEAKGDHHHFKHPDKTGKVTVPHPKKDLTTGTVLSILRQAGLKKKDWRP